MVRKPLTDADIERRLRRIFRRHGFVFHKTRKKLYGPAKGYRYWVEYGYCTADNLYNLDQMIAFAERLDDR